MLEPETGAHAFRSSLFLERRANSNRSEVYFRELLHGTWRCAFNRVYSKEIPRKLPYVFRGLCLCAAVMFGSSPSAFASPSHPTSFDQFALSCAPGVELLTLRAVARIESNFEPLALRDNTSHETLKLQNLAAAIMLANDRVRLGHSIDIGIMQINSGNLASLGMSVADAFDECRSLAASSRILRSVYAAGSSESQRQAAILISLSRYNTGHALAGIASGYSDRVIGAQSDATMDSKTLRGALAKSSQWDIWSASGAASTSWVVAADNSSEFERAGAQSTEARADWRAMASPSKRGEPYELFAYQKGEPVRP